MNDFFVNAKPIFVQEDNMNEKICNHCGYSNPMENNYCASCGSPFEDRVPDAKRKGEGLSKKTMFLVSLAVTVVINVCMANGMPTLRIRFMKLQRQNLHHRRLP